MRPRVLEARHGRVQAIVTPNGRLRASVVLYELGGDTKTPVWSDDANVASARDRDAFLDRTPTQLRADAQVALLQLSADVTALRALSAGAGSGAEDGDEAGDAGEARPPALSDDALAQAFTTGPGEDYRYTAAVSQWRHWDGVRWADDSTLRIYDLARHVARQAAAAAGQPKLAAAVASAKSVAAIERLARADRAHARRLDEWDQDPMLLNTPGGTVDLRSGELRPHRREDYITRSTTVSPGGGCPTWLAFLERITGGDAGRIGYLKRGGGYSLTGDTREHALFFLFGLGANGKSTFLATLLYILADYARVLAAEALIASPHDRHPAEIAVLRGARLVVAQEVEEGRPWAEARVKQLTGDGVLTARFMRGNPFDFVPEFKLWVAANHKPSLRTVDEAISRRFKLIPFDQVIPAGERDALLGAKLRTEAPGILAWLVEGCQEWLKLGLRAPDSVQLATCDYLAEEDSLQAWLDACCDVKPSLEATAAELFASWRGWAERAGEKPGSAKSFSAKLQGKGFRRTTIGHGKAKGYRGLSVKPDTREAYLNG